MKKEIKGFVTIDRQEMTNEEKKQRLAKFFVLLHNWKQEELATSIDKEATNKNS